MIILAIPILLCIAIYLARQYVKRQYEEIIKDINNDLIKYKIKVEEGINQEKEYWIRELHDNIASQTTSIRFILEGILYNYEGNNKSSLEKLLHQIRKLSNDVYLYVREGSAEKLNLRDELSFLINAFQNEKHAPKISLNYQLDSALNSKTNMYLLRIIQESINNIIKHAESSEVEISILEDYDEMYIKISDDGKGFEVSQIMNADRINFGLRGIKKKVDELNGNIQITSIPKIGTLIDISIPLNQKA
ncbi:MAG: ATP-binding protein [Bacteroidota bacterium]